MDQMQLFENMTEISNTARLHIWAKGDDRDDPSLYCTVRHVNMETDSVDFHVENGCWDGTLYLNKNLIEIVLSDGTNHMHVTRWIVHDLEVDAMYLKMTDNGFF